jgi:serine/threonine protein kinase
MPDDSGFIKDVSLRAEQFQSAIRYFNQHPNAKKLSRKEESDFFNSYIKLDDGTILALSSAALGGTLLGQGTFGRGKLAMDAEGNFYAVKIETTNTEIQNLETSTLENLGLLAHPKTSIQRTKLSEKHYTALVYLGKNLSANLYAVEPEYLPSLSRKIAWALHQLHSGSVSQDGTGYAHLDLRPGNIVIDHENRIYLIDFGTAHPLNGALYSECFTTSLYAPATYTEQQLVQADYAAIIGPRLVELGPKNIDHFALKRTLYLPTPERSEDPSDHGYCLFSRRDFAALPQSLQEMINTTDLEKAMSRQDDDTAIKMALAFLALECDIDIDDLDILSAEEQEQICEIASQYSVPVSQDDEEEMHQNHANMKIEIQKFLDEKSPRCTKL